MLKRVGTTGISVDDLDDVRGRVGLLVTLACLLVDALVALGKGLSGEGFLYPSSLHDIALLSLLGVQHHVVTTLDRHHVTAPNLRHPVSLKTLLARSLLPPRTRGRLPPVHHALLADFGHLAFEAVLETNHFIIVIRDETEQAFATNYKYILWKTFD